MSWKALGLAAVLCCLASSVGFAENKPILHFDRLAGWLEPQYVIYRESPTLDYSGFRLKNMLSYGLTSKLGLQGASEIDFGYHKYKWSGQASVALYGTEPSDRFHLGMVLLYSFYEGDGYKGIKPDSDWEAGLRGGWSIGHIKNPVNGKEKTIVAFKPFLLYAPNQQDWEIGMSFGLQYFGGWGGGS